MAATRDRLGEERIAWLAVCRRMQEGPVLIHPIRRRHGSLGARGSDAELESIYAPLGHAASQEYRRIHRYF